MTNTIPNVPRELLDSLLTVIESNGYAADEVEVVDELRVLLSAPSPADHCEDVRAMVAAPSPADHCEDVRAMVAAPSPAGVDGLEVIGWYTDDHLDDKSATTYSMDVADRWLAKGWPVTGIANAADAQDIIEGLRGEVEERVEAALAADRAVRHQQAQRIGELEWLLREVAATLAWIAHGECRAIHDGPIMPSQMALDAVKAALGGQHERR